MQWQENKLYTETDTSLRTPDCKQEKAGESWTVTYNQMG